MGVQQRLNRDCTPSPLRTPIGSVKGIDSLSEDLTFALKIDVDSLAFIRQLPDKSQEIIDGKIKKLKR
jgi:hypothetical protein